MKGGNQYTSALTALRAPLVFGNEKQITAVRLIELVESCVDAIKACEHMDDDNKCPDCEGEGTVECECECGDVHDKDCDTCDGSGMQTEKGCPGCLLTFTPEIIALARSKR